MTITVVQKGARKNARMLQRTAGRFFSSASFGSSAAQSTR